MTETYYHLSTFSLEYISLESLQNIGDRLSIIFIFRIGISKYFVERVKNNPSFIFCMIMKFAKFASSIISSSVAEAHCLHHSEFTQNCDDCDITKKNVEKYQTQRKYG